MNTSEIQKYKKLTLREIFENSLLGQCNLKVFNNKVNP